MPPDAIRLIMRRSIATMPLTKSFAICEATSGVGCMTILADRKNLRHPFDEQADRLVVDLDDQNGVTGGQLGGREAEPTAKSMIGNTFPRRLMTPQTKPGA